MSYRDRPLKELNYEKNVPADYCEEMKENDPAPKDQTKESKLHEDINNYLESLEEKVKVLHENQRQLQVRIDEINNIKRDIENILFGGR